MTLRITILIEPARVEVPAGMAGQHEDDPLARYQAFAAALRGYGAEVEVRPGFLRDAPDGFVIVRSSGYEAMMDEIAEDQRAGVAARTILLDVDRGTVLAWLERYAFAGAVEKLRWMAWRREPQHEYGGGLHGRRDVAPLLGSSANGATAFSSEHYDVLGSDRYRDLPGLVVGYLEAVAASAALRA